MTHLLRQFGFLSEPYSELYSSRSGFLNSLASLLRPRALGPPLFIGKGGEKDEKEK